MTDAAQIKSEIARLTASISQHKSTTSAPRPPTSTTAWPPRSSTYINPNYKPPSNKYIRPAQQPRPQITRPPSTSATPNTTKEVVLNGVAFESSTRSLVRKDLPKPAAPKSKPVSTSSTPAAPSRHAHTPHFRPPPQRIYKPKTSRGRGRGRARGGPVNMTLTNSRRPYTSSRPKRPKSDKPCPRFSTTGTCTRGLTCPYTHDPATTAICWPFLSGTCPLPAAQCALSHDPTPERTPLCTHFLGGAFRLCTRPACPFPHVNVGPRSGVCRAFAVLGYCPLGLECDKAHVRECPDFAETGSCPRSEAALGKGGKGGCKLPHVIRAAGARKLGPGGGAGARGVAAMKGKGAVAAVAGDGDAGKASEREKEKEEEAAKSATAAAEMGDEFISLTFNESSEDEGSDSEEEDESESGEEGAEKEGEGEDGEGEDDDEPASKSEDGDDEQMDGGGGGAAA
ncbi:hypothetical protein B0H14DRAFT_2467386 [Mycena olivaceomarginata]|nr:hypothetical protein B0H14DRAFT_2467386 [Mycena olivaceomarginata]